MLNKLWGLMIICGVIYAAFTGKLNDIGTASLDSAKEAVSLCVTMLGIMSLWTGLMNVAKRAGIIDALTRGLRPVLAFLFPEIPRDHIANEYMSANIIANVLGLGWAATPMGLKAMKELREIQREQEGETNRASNAMCTFLVINISSLQVIPVSVIAYRSQYGSVNPAAIVMQALIATLISTIVGVLFCKLMCRRRKAGNVS